MSRPTASEIKVSLNIDSSKGFYYKHELDAINSELRILAREMAFQFWAQRDPRTEPRNGRR